MNRKPGDWNCTACDHLNFSWRESCQRCSDPKQGDGYGGRSDEDGDYNRRPGSGRSHGGGSSGGYYGRNQSGGDYRVDYRSDYRGDPRNDYRGDYRGDYRSDYRGDNRGDNRGDYRGDYRGGGGGGYAGDYRNNYESSKGYGGYGGSDLRPGDWYCKDNGCGAHNFASRTNCFKCGSAKENCSPNGRGGGGYDSGRGGGYDSDRRGYDSGSRGSRRGYGEPYYESANGSGGGRPGWKSGDWICTRSQCSEHNFASRTECFRCQAPREA